MEYASKHSLLCRVGMCTTAEFELFLKDCFTVIILAYLFIFFQVAVWQSCEHLKQEMPEQHDIPLVIDVYKA